MIKGLRQFISAEAYSPYDLIVSLIAYQVGVILFSKDVGFLYVLGAIGAIVFAGGYLRGMLIAFIDDWLKAKAEKSADKKDSQFSNRNGKE